MRMLKKIVARKYLQRILLFLNLAMLLLVLVLTATLYAYSERLLLRQQNEFNAKVLSQVKYNINYLQEIAKSVAVNTFFDQSFVTVMNKSGTDIFADYQIYRKIDLLVESNSFLHSMLVLNGKQGTLYSGGGTAFHQMSGARREQMFNEMKRRLNNDAGTPRLRLLPISLNGDPSRIDYFTLFMYDLTPSGDMPKNAIVLNLYPSWVMDNLHEINQLGQGSKGKIYLLDMQNRILQSGNGVESEEESASQQLVRDYVADHPTARAFVKYEWRGETYIVSRQTFGDGQWQFVGIEPYGDIMESVRNLRNISLIVLFCFVLLSFLLSAYISSRLYRPMDSLLLQLRRQTPSSPETDGPPTKDEFHFISRSYQGLMTEFELKKREHHKMESVIAVYHIRRWLADSRALSDGEWREFIEPQPFLPAGPKTRLRIAVLSIDSSRRLKETEHGPASGWDDAAVGRIAEEIVRRRYPCLSIDMRNDAVALIVGADGPDGDAEELVPLLRETQGAIADYYGMTLSAAVGDPVRDARRVSDDYRLIAQMLDNRMIYGAEAIITPDMVSDRALKQAEFSFPPDFGKKLMHAIHTKDTEAFERLIDGLIADMSGYHVDYIDPALLELMIMIKRIFRELEKYAPQGRHPELQELNEQVVRAGSLAEAAELLKAFLRRYADMRQDAKENKNQALVDTIKEMIEKNYMDPNISLQGIAALLKMSPAYVGRIFRQSEAMSAAEYLNHIRLERARQYIEGSSYGIKEIAEKTGFSSLSYFSTLFKKKYGFAPKDYQTQFTLRSRNAWTDK